MTTQSRRRRQFQLYFTLARSARNYYGNFLLCVCVAYTTWCHSLLSLQSGNLEREREREVDDDAEASKAQHRWSRHPHSSAHVCIPAPLLQSWRSVRRHSSERARDFSPKSRRRKHSRHISRYTHFKFRDFTSHKLSKSSKTPSNQLGFQTKNWLDGV